MPDPTLMTTKLAADQAIAAWCVAAAEHPGQPRHAMRRMAYREAERAIRAVPDASARFRLWFKLMMARNDA